MNNNYRPAPSAKERQVAGIITRNTKMIAKLVPSLGANPEDVETREAIILMMALQEEIIKAWKGGAATQEDLDFIDRTGEEVTKLYAGLTVVQNDFIENHSI